MIHSHDVAPIYGDRSSTFGIESMEVQMEVK